MKLFLLSIVLLYCGDKCYADSVTLLRADGTPIQRDDEIYIPFGEPLELFCTGKSHELVMVKDDEYLKTTIVNETTVRLFEERPKRGYAFYVCRIAQSSNIATALVVVDSPPEARDFSCISYNLEYLRCTWRSLNVLSRFSLYYVKDGLPFLLCKVVKSYELMSCEWGIEHPVPYEQFAEHLTFILETCSMKGCANQKFNINHYAVIKPYPPVNLHVLHKTSHSATVAWSIPKNIQGKHITLDHRLYYYYVYGLGGSRRQQINATEVQTYDDRQIIELKLPCSDTFYELHVSIKTQTAVGDQFWSDESVILFVTDVSSTDYLDSNCFNNNESKKWEVSDLMLFKMEHLKSNIKYELSHLKAKIHALKSKLIGIWSLKYDKDSFCKTVERH